MTAEIQKFLQQTGYDGALIESFLSKRNRTVADLYCKCGKPKRLVINKKQNWTSLDYYCGESACNRFYGVKRPDHSLYMKALAKDETSNFAKNLIRAGELFNKNVNSIQFLRKKLQNKGYNVSDISDDSVIAMNSSYEKDKNLSRSCLEATIKTYIEKYKWDSLVEFVNNRNVSDLSNDEFSKVVALWRSMYHEVFCSDVCGAKHFKRQILTDLKYNRRGKVSVKTKSSYETNYIMFFEGVGIKWDYEPVKIKCVDGFSYYKPDFWFIYNERQFLMEVKGYLIKNNLEKYLKNKINAGYKYANDNGMSFVFTYDGFPSSIDQIISNVMKEEF
jgi:hypothetical protein